MVRRFSFGVLIALMAVDALNEGRGLVAGQAEPARAAAAGAQAAGATTTRLPDGRLLVLGGTDASGPLRTASIVDASTQQTTALPAGMIERRAGHSATLLPDGTVLVLGGRGAGGQALVTAERFDPATAAFTPLLTSAWEPRAFHTATVLTDGRVLIVGGAAAGGTAAEIWDVDSAVVTPVAGGPAARARHAARLLADGRVLITGGVDSSERPVPTNEVFTPGPDRIAAAREPALADPEVPSVTETAPANGAVEVPLDVRIAFRFSRPLLPATVNADTFALSGPHGAVEVHVTPAEGGRLAFIRPAERLAPNTAYVLAPAGATDPDGAPLVAGPLRFVTTSRSSEPEAPETVDEEPWLPDAGSARTGWRTNRPKSPWESLPPLQAPPGVTAIAGQVLTLDGQPLTDVTLGIDDAETRSDRTGRFLLTLESGSSGHHELEIDGGTASRGHRRYGFFEYGLTVKAGETTVLPFVIWMPRLDTAHEVAIPSPTTTETVITTPYIPGLELHLPAGTVILGEDGAPVTRLGITPIPVDRPPFPLPRHVEVPVYFTIQPGGAYVRTRGYGSRGAWLVYPNYRGGVPGQRIQFFHYEPEERGWYVYGLGTVTENGAQVVPDPTTRLYEFTGAMINSGNSPPNRGGTPGGPERADPVDPSTGVFLLHDTDLYLPDVMPLALTRTYNSGDNLARPFGRGMTHPYAMFLWSAQQYQQADLILPEGGKIHYVRTSAGTGFTDAVFVHQETATTSATPTAFYKSVLSWNGNGWDLTLKDGTVYVFGDEAPVQAIRDRYGNQTTVTWSTTNVFGSGTGNITRITSPNGRWIAFSYNANNRVAQAQDNLGRTVAYTYDANGNLATVTDPENHVTTYTYDASNRLASIRDGRGIVFVTNQYDANGRVAVQTLADPAHVYRFAYTTDASGNITQTDITDPRGHVERLAFNGDRHIVSRTQALGTPLERTMTIERQSGSNIVAATVDALNRRTTFTYDDEGYLLSVTQLAGTPDAVTTSYTYEPKFHQVATATDPLGHTWTREYDSSGRLAAMIDPLTHRTSIALNAAGQLSTVTNPLQHATRFGYTGGDLTSITDPLNRTATQFVDAGGRTLRVTNAAGHDVRWEVDNLNRVTSVADPVGGVTRFSYDPNGRVLSLSDALSRATTYTYDGSDRLATHSDQLQQVESYVYDGLSNLTEFRDRKGQATTYAYDALDRLQIATYADGSTVEYVYDAGDRLTRVIDSSTGTIELSWDPLNRLQSETTPEGTVSYTYDADGRRATMTVLGQPTVSYDYDADHRLTAVTRGDLTTTITYDDADRRDTVTLPNGLITDYQWDAASQLTGLTYRHDANVLGTLTYAYDAAGNRTIVGGTWARTGLPPAVSNALYDAANRLVELDGTTLSYDANGNLTGDGARSYVWNARDELVALSGGVNASFSYDGVGRRRARTVAGATARFLYDGVDAVQELTAAGTPSANLFSGLAVDEVFTRLDAGGAQHFAADAIGSAVALTDAAGAVRTQYTYAPFGESVQSGSSSQNAAQFTGRENDGSGLYYYRGRYLHTGLQRFISEDPIGIAGGDTNLYAYVFNAPTMYRDPSGELAPLAAVAARVAGAAAVRCIRAAAQSALTDYASGRKIDWGSAAADCAMDALMPGGSGARNAARNATRPTKYRKKTVQDAWDNARDGSKPGTKACPTCGTDVTVKPGEGPRDWDIDHQPPWSTRDHTDMTRPEVLDDFNSGTRLECPGCNRSGGARPRP